MSASATQGGRNELLAVWSALIDELFDGLITEHFSTASKLCMNLRFW